MNSYIVWLRMLVRIEFELFLSSVSIELFDDLSRFTCVLGICQGTYSPLQENSAS